MVSKKEVQKIHADKSIAHIEMDSFIPYWVRDPLIFHQKRSHLYMTFSAKNTTKV